MVGERLVLVDWWEQLVVGAIGVGGERLVFVEAIGDCGEVSDM